MKRGEISRDHATTFFSMIDAALREYYNKKLEPLSTKGLTELLVPPSFFEIENAISNLQESDGWFRDFWIVIMDRLFAILPLLLILYMTYSVIVMPDIHLIWSLPCIILVFIICLRGFWIYRCSLKAIVLQNS